MIKLHRVDYAQTGLTSKNTLRILDTTTNEDGQLLAATAAIGDHSGSLLCFVAKIDQSYVETVHQTPPIPNAKIQCLEVVGGSGSPPKVIISMGTMSIHGYTKKGKHFIGLELSNLTEPINFLKLRWPNDIYICGDYMYSHFYFNADNPASGEMGNLIQTRNFYICPEKITALILLEDRPRRRSAAVASKDRLIRIIRESICEFEIETSGIPTSLINVANMNKHSQEVYFCYGSTDGKISLISINMSQKPLTPQHRWEIPEQGPAKAPVEILATVDTGRELYVGRSDGTIEIWSFSGGIDIEGEEMLNPESAPIMLGSFNCGETITSIAATPCGSLLICCTFTGVVFGLTRNDTVSHRQNPNYLVLEKEAQLKIEILKAECEQLEMRLIEERARYQEMTMAQNVQSKKSSVPRVGLSAIPYFAINDSFILQEDASYLLSLEIEVAIDAVIVQSDIALDLIDCERNSAVVSFSETYSQEVLATFRCQSNTTRLEIKIRSVEGQYGLLRIYVMTRMTPKSCQVKHYQIKPLSLHKRGFPGKSDEDLQQYLNKLTISGNFSVNEGHNWIQQCLPEVPERIASTTTNKSSSYKFVSTFCDTILVCEFGKGSIVFQSDNVSTISIIKDFITREATKRSQTIEMNVSTNDGSVGHTLRQLYPKVSYLVRKKQTDRLREAVKEVSATDADVATSILHDLQHEEAQDPLLATFNLERLYGLITDLYIDHHKLRGSASRATLNAIRSKIGDLILLIDTTVFENASAEEFSSRVNQFWGLYPSQ